MKTIIFYTWPLIALVAMVGGVAAVDPGITGKLLRALIDIALA
ncbi:MULTISPECIES: hypothetical protein [unclassified Mesorhizobium]|nr:MULTISPECIES: hypothetical protein [unclassified Mesorhizobium]ESX98712.1 hypothetical protein X755_15275 [Mesorhizobium sp. LNJC405B00]ESY42003.1 hypothetical protein X747_14435 [Mesorhizobium sp. LNJC384A00]